MNDCRIIDEKKKIKAVKYAKPDSPIYEARLPLRSENWNKIIAYCIANWRKQNELSIEIES